MLWSSSSSRLIVPALRRGASFYARKALSSSTIVARKATGSHLFRIRGYSLIDRMLPDKEDISSGEFTAANHEWKLLYTPNDGSYVWICPFLNYEGTNEVYATYRASILDRDGKPAFGCTVGPLRYTTWLPGEEPPNWRRIQRAFEVRGAEEVDDDDDYPGGELASTEELRDSMDWLIDDDVCLSIRYDVTVLEFEPESHIRADDE